MIFKNWTRLYFRNSKVYEFDTSQEYWLAVLGLQLDLDSTFVSKTINILSWLHLENHNVYKVDTWQGYWLGGTGVQLHEMVLI